MRRLIALTLVLLLAACSPTDDSTSTSVVSSTISSTTTSTSINTTTTVAPDFGVTSPAFDEGGPIPIEYTCDGDDVSPELEVVGIPEGTASIVIIVDDPDAPLGTWTHWLAFDIATGPGSYDVARDTPPIGVSGTNSWNLEGYMGPCPPQGEDHTYHFQVYALSTMLGLPGGVDVGAVTDAMAGSIVDTVGLTGTYSR